MFQRSAEGALVEAETAWPAVVPLFRRCAQNVSPTEVSTNWWCIVWLAPRVRAAARSQSLPTAKTIEPLAAGVIDTEAAPVPALALATEPTDDAPLKAL